MDLEANEEEQELNKSLSLWNINIQSQVPVTLLYFKHHQHQIPT